METLDAVLGSHDTAEVLSVLLDGDVIRRLRRDGDNIAIDACDGRGECLVLPASTPLRYAPWPAWRGSAMFRAELDGVQQWLNLATELDPIHYPDGTKATVSAPAQLVGQ